jgi:predicted RNA-binding Zn-ribbon protein involved in translation (DUF1610 family)
MTSTYTRGEMAHVQSATFTAPCPGCGATNCELDEVEAPIDIGFSLPSYRVVCPACGFAGPDSRDARGPSRMLNAILLWNRRTPLSPEATAKLVAQRINPPKV